MQSYYFDAPNILLLVSFSMVYSHPHPLVKSAVLIKYYNRNNEGSNFYGSEVSKSKINSTLTDVNVTFGDISQMGSVKKAEKDHGYSTVIIVFVLILMTIVVKTVPVIITYSLPYFYGNDSNKTGNQEHCSDSKEIRYKGEDKPIMVDLSVNTINQKEKEMSPYEFKINQLEKDSIHCDLTQYLNGTHKICDNHVKINQD